jgi:hypothetical protein
MKRILMLAAAALLGAACGDSMTGPDFSGTYVLQRLNGSTLPAPVPGGIEGQTANATGGTVQLNADRTVMAELNVELFIGGGSVAATNAMRGTYTVHRDTVFARDAAGGEIFSAVITGNVLVADMGGLVFAFARK